MRDMVAHGVLLVALLMALDAEMRRVVRAMPIRLLVAAMARLRDDVLMLAQGLFWMVVWAGLARFIWWLEMERAHATFVRGCTWTDPECQRHLAFDSGRAHGRLAIAWGLMTPAQHAAEFTWAPRVDLPGAL
jgi:hypothetical protein